MPSIAYSTKTHHHHNQAALPPASDGLWDVDIGDEDAMFLMGMSYGHIAGVHGWKDLHLHYLFVSQFTAEVFGYNGVDDFIGSQLSVADARCPAAELAATFDEEDHWVVREKKPMLKLEYLCFSDNRCRAMLGRKYPVFNQQGEVFAVGMSIQDITGTDLAILNHDVLCGQRSRSYGSAAQYNYVIDCELGNVCLTDRQKEIVFYLLRGHTASSMASRMGIAVCTAQGHLDVLKHKMGCQSKRQLVEQLLSLGYLNLLPKSCVEHASSLIRPDTGVQYV